MTVSGRLWAELAWVAFRDADAVLGSGIGCKPDPFAPRPDRAQIAEAERLTVLGARWSYLARQLGFCEQGTDAVFGDEPQHLAKCWCGRRFDLHDWQKLALVGVQRKGHACREIRLCDLCGRTMGVETRGCPRTAHGCSEAPGTPYW